MTKTGDRSPSHVLWIGTDRDPFVPALSCRASGVRPPRRRRVGDEGAIGDEAHDGPRLAFEKAVQMWRTHPRDCLMFQTSVTHLRWHSAPLHGILGCGDNECMPTSESCYPIRPEFSQALRAPSTISSHPLSMTGRERERERERGGGEVEATPMPAHNFRGRAAVRGALSGVRCRTRLITV